MEKIRKLKARMKSENTSAPPAASGPRLRDRTSRIQEQVEMEERRLEKANEAIAMDTFKQRISSYRNSQARYRNPMAPGFDYANWKPYGTVRYRDPELEYHRLATSLAPYVRAVVESGCLGVEERRWAAMTQLHPEDVAIMESRMESRVASRAVSRAGSRDQLAPSR